MRMTIMAMMEKKRMKKKTEGIASTLGRSTALIILHIAVETDISIEKGILLPRTESLGIGTSMSILMMSIGTEENEVRNLIQKEKQTWKKGRSVQNPQINQKSVWVKVPVEKLPWIYQIPTKILGPHLSPLIPPRFPMILEPKFGQCYWQPCSVSSKTILFTPLFCHDSCGYYYSAFVVKSQWIITFLPLISPPFLVIVSECCNRALSS